MIDQRAAGGWDNTSTVVTAGATCPAPKQNNECKNCRNCWTKSIKNISYGKHWCGSFKIINGKLDITQATSRKLQAASHTRQYLESSKLQRFKPQATSLKPQAASLKLQAASSKLLNLATLVKFQAARGEVHRKDKTILGMLQMECKLVWWEAKFITFGYF